MSKPITLYDVDINLETNDVEVKAVMVHSKRAINVIKKNQKKILDIFLKGKKQENNPKLDNYLLSIGLFNTGGIWDIKKY